MTCDVGPAQRGQCPGTGERGHGMTMRFIHCADCRDKWDAADTATRRGIAQARGIDPDFYLAGPPRHGPPVHYTPEVPEFAAAGRTGDQREIAGISSPARVTSLPCLPEGHTDPGLADREAGS